MPDLPRIKLKIDDENSGNVMLKLLLVLYTRSMSEGAMFLEMYGKVMNLSREEVVKRQQEYFEHATAETKAYFSKFGDLEIL